MSGYPTCTRIQELGPAMDTTVFARHESTVRGYSRAFPTVFASASNARQTAEDGTEYIDFFAGAGVLNFGHNNPRMKKALIDFLEADGLATAWTCTRPPNANSSAGFMRWCSPRAEWSTACSSWDPPGPAP